MYSPDLVGPILLSSVKELGSEPRSSFLMQSSADLKTHETMFTNTASEANAYIGIQEFHYTDLLSIMSCPLPSLLLLVDSVTMWDGVSELLSVAPSVEFSTMNLYFFQLWAFG